MLRFSFIVLCVISFQAMGAATGFEQAGTNQAVQSVGCWSWLCGSSPTLTSPARGNITGAKIDIIDREVISHDQSTFDDLGKKQRWDALSVTSSQSASPRSLLGGAISDNNKSELGYCMSLDQRSGLEYLGSLPKYGKPYVTFLRSLRESGVITQDQVSSWTDAYVDAIKWLFQDYREILKRKIMRDFNVLDASKRSMQSVAQQWHNLSDESLGRTVKFRDRSVADVSNETLIDLCYIPFKTLIEKLIQDHLAVIPDRQLKDFIENQINAIPISLSAEHRRGFSARIIQDINDSLKEERRLAAQYELSITGKVPTEYSDNESVRGVGDVTSLLKTPFPVDQSECQPDTGAGVGLVVTVDL